MPLANPNVTASLRAAGVTAGLTPEKLLIVAQMTTGTATAGQLYENILNDGAEDALFGANAPVAHCVRRARRRNDVTQIDVIPLGAGTTAATGQFAISGTATETETLKFYVGSKKFGEYKIAVTSGDTAATVATALAAAIQADTDALCSASASSGNVTITCDTAGTFGNTIGLKTDGSVAGISVTVTGMASGAGDPSLTGVFDVIGNQRYQGYVWQFQEEIDTVKDFLDGRFNVANNILDGVAFVGKTDTQANHLTELNALNSKSLSYNVDKLISGTDGVHPAVFDVPVLKVAEFAAIRALRRTDESVLGDLVISRSQNDSFGGAHMNSKPYFNTPFPDLKTPDVGDSFTDTEIAQLLAAGGWVIDANRPFTSVIAGEVVTTYKTDAAGNPDPSFGYLNYVDTSSAAREYIVNNTRAKFPQYRATGGALIQNVDSANEASVAAYVTELNADLGALALVNTGVGSVEGKQVDYDKAFADNLTVSLNPVTGKFTVSCTLYIVVQLRGVTYDLPVAFEL